MHPLLVSRVVFPLIEYAKRKPTHARLRELEQSERLAPETIRGRQLERLRRHLEFAYREVPYYTQLFDEHGVKPAAIERLEDLARIPCLTKDLIRARFADLQPRHRPRHVQARTSGGSTGAPVTVLVDMDRLGFTEAARLRAHRWFGVGMGAREVVLWGSSIELTAQDRIRRLRDRMINSRLLSAFDLGDESLGRYAEIIRRDRPQKLFGYASALHRLAAYLERTGWVREPGWPRAVFTTAEPLYDFQRATIEAVFGCPVSVEYGCREIGFVAAECPAGGLHVAAEGIVVETLEDGEIVLTHLDARAMPMIRYRTGDVGSLVEGPCPCGRGLPRLGPIQGRVTDFIVTPRGKVVHALALIYVLREVPGVKEFQVVQDRVDYLTVTVVPGDGFDRSSQAAMTSRLAHVLDDAVRIEVALVGAIPRPPSGKHRHVISKVANGGLGVTGAAQAPSG
ncbi:MAG: phenylacetate--CoA ligase family protein [Candidatus Rokuibacteriota bacterium]